MTARNMLLTTPHMKGDDVRALQLALKAHGYLQNGVDGEFGPDTHRAVYKAKYWLGYSQKNLNHVAGPILLDLLNGREKPSLIMQSRIKKRKKKEPLGLKIVKSMITDLGYTEKPPGSNGNKFGEWYGFNWVPWCAMFGSFHGSKAGAKAFLKGHRWAYCPFVFADAQAGRNNLAITYSPVTGDIVLYDWDKNHVADHYGTWVAEPVLRDLVPTALKAAIADQGRLAPGQFWAIEGNTAFGNNSNGGKVMIRKRSKSDVQAFVHIGG